MPYTHFRYIAWEIPTATFKTNMQADGISGWDPGQECQPVQRIPVPSSVTDADAKIRLKRLAAVVNAAAYRLANTVGGDNVNTLKIFMVPEFYFRPPVISQSYYSNTYPNTVKTQIIEALNTMFGHADFSHWLFVCGTVMWNTRQDIHAAPLYFNTAVYVWGGHADSLRVIEKQLPSGIDGLPVGAAPGHDPSVKLFFESWKTRKRRVFDIDGIPMGLEVCLDHLNSPNCRVLKNVLSDWEQKEGNGTEIKLHLLTAGGMSIQPKSVSAKVNGYILRDDGITSSAGTARSNLQLVQSYTWDNPLLLQLLGPPTGSDLKATATLTNVGAAHTYALPAGPLRIPIPVGGYLSFTQQLVFYPPLGVPA